MNNSQSMTASDDMLRLYMKDVQHYPLLTEAQEYALAKKAANGDRAAMNALTEGNLRLVVDTAFKFAPYVPSHMLMDLIQEGNLGLMRAVELFDYTRGYRFSTFGYWRILQRMQRYVYAAKLPVHLAARAAADLVTAKRFYHSLSDTLGRNPTIGELSYASHIPEDRITLIYSWLKTTYHSLDTPLGADDTRTYYDFLIDPEDAYSAIEDEMDMRIQIASFLELLPAKERKIVEMYYGLNGEAPCMNCGPIAQSFQVTRQRIQQQHKSAIKRIQAHVALVSSEIRASTSVTAALSVIP
ncbi:sigma-70 family RNA polymerase sigma factor [Tengunoibacter tsumagoiensis]|uniref:RNA polymerase sigma-70 domain-containing protein n=1 Tax=Tengunoibacter tsumagoiensis TaxID=2014871 RepID=A0A402A8A3_9CHLR|nr:sigma-70 family RNA polymerase sigma factor [Tengunoibacter tsumagoiensis]GCE15318.1 hypothetical protein KTT_51770 [Tengunoibacter tsumagoiensis]